MTERDDDARVRELLANLPADRDAPAMPPELVARIEASLAEERRPAGAPVVPLATRRRRRAVGPWVLGAAAAAALVITVPVLVERSGSDADESDAGQAVEHAPPESGRDAAEESRRPPFALTISDRAYTERDLGEQAARALSPQDLVRHAVPSFSAESPSLGPIATEQGAADCLARLGAGEVRPVLVDVGSFDGQRGFLVVAEGEGLTRAWAVAAGCEPIYDEPTTLP